MSYYGGDRTRNVASPQGADRFAAVARAVRRQAGPNARVTVETGAENKRSHREHENYTFRVNIDDEPGNLERIRRRRQERVARPIVYYEQVSDQASRRNSLPTRTRYSSPGFRPSRPPSEPSPDAEIVVEAPAIIEDSYGFVEDLDFKIPKAPEGVHFSDDVGFVIPDPGSHASKEKPSALSKPKFTGEMTELVIANSNWVGNTFERGELGAQLDVAAVEPGASDTQKSQMRWYHLHRPMMSLEEFIAASQSVLRLPEKEQRDVFKLLRDVQKKFEKQRHNGRELEANCVSDIFYNDSTGTSKQMESVMFLCFQYFCLEPYSSSPIKALTPGSPMHPARPILQAHFYSSSGKRELAQAITTLPSTPSGECLHISQLWCLIVNGSAMVTCSRQSIDALCNNTITRSIKQHKNDETVIKVSMGSDRSWSIPVTAETSWPAFLAFFGEKAAGMEAQGASAQFEYDKKIIDGKIWRELLEAAKTATIELTMQDVRFHITDADEQMIEHQIDLDGDDETMVGAEDEIASSNASGMELAHEASKLPQAVQPAASTPLEPSANLQLFQYSGSTTEMRDLADGLHKILLSNERTNENAAYRECPKAKLADITVWLRSDSRRKERNLRSEESRLLRKPKRRIVIVAKYLFSMFFPRDFEHAMTDRYWGALSKILNREDESYAEGHNNPKSDVAAAVDMYNLLHDEILPLASTLAEEFTGYEQDLIPLPNAFSKAWLHLVTAIVLTSEKPMSLVSSFRESVVSKHFRAITEELEKGKVEIMTRLHSIDLDDLEICTESSILALLVDKLAQDVMHGAPGVVTSYATYFQRLEFSVTDDPAPRYHQQKILHFLQEVEAILATLEHQLSVVETFQTSLEQQTANNDAILIYSLGQSRQSAVIEDCKARIGGKLDKFKGLQKRAEHLGEWHRNEMDTHKDRQESAILVFTIVTIIFLPLSFVSSLFGMNTEDIRDMTYNQWAYWAAAVPLTILVVFGSLWFAGELGSIDRWISGLAHRSSPTSNGQQASLEGATTRPHTARMDRPNTYNETEQLSSRSRRRTTYPRGEV